MNLEFKEKQNFRKWWHYAIAGFPVIIISSMFCLVQFDLVSTKNNQKEPLIFLILIVFTILIFIWFLFYLVTSRRILALVLVPVQVLALILEVGRDYSILLAVFLAPLLGPLL